MELYCPFSEYGNTHDVPIPDTDLFSILGDKFLCPICGKTVFLTYESIYDEETQDANGWFYLEGVEAS